MSGIHNFELDLYRKDSEKIYFTEDTPLIPNTVKNASHSITILTMKYICMSW